MSGSFVAMWFAFNFARLQFETEKSSADFRFRLVNVRMQAEQIALYGGEKTEKNTILQKFEAMLEFTLRSIYWGVGMAAWEFIFHTAVTMTPNVLLAQKYFQGQLDFGAVGQMQGAYAGLVSNLCFL